MNKVSLKFQEIEEVHAGSGYSDGCSGGRSDCCTRVCTRANDSSDDSSDGSLAAWDDYFEVNAGVLQY
ncbi:hypothetical protein QCD60_12855 [Pokkaliibacter sp. MBI-7]|uniref:hypothetical protein n=1 Tax=Pokkaliibacter sp. MBI-7 TaxID=3040600 RepID=UPI00244B149B|nr:hypothetical protein [Pokkaliibacter sp. MBI-7]MDH2433463.1 hypothetical protein [Pokkaliibacter sp. MBI-7]